MRTYILNPLFAVLAMSGLLLTACGEDMIAQKSGSLIPFEKPEDRTLEARGLEILAKMNIDTTTNSANMKLIIAESLKGVTAEISAFSFDDIENYQLRLRFAELSDDKCNEFSEETPVKTKSSFSESWLTIHNIITSDNKFNKVDAICTDALCGGMVLILGNISKSNDKVSRGAIAILLEAKPSKDGVTPFRPVKTSSGKFHNIVGVDQAMLNCKLDQDEDIEKPVEGSAEGSAEETVKGTDPTNLDEGGEGKLVPAVIRDQETHLDMEQEVQNSSGPIVEPEVLVEKPVETKISLGDPIELTSEVKPGLSGHLRSSPDDILDAEEAANQPVSMDRPIDPVDD